MSTPDNVKPLLPTLVAGSRGIVPTDFDQCWRLGQVLAKSGLVPDNFKGKPEDCTVAILQGLELGLSPVAALQSIAIVNGRPSLYGDGFLAVIRASGLLEWVKETDDGKVATCVMKRRGEPEPITRTFSIADAEKAGLAKKSGPWTSYPARMRQMRARGFCGRDGFADVLKGLSLAEEAHDIPMRDVTPKPQISVPDIPDEPFEGARSAPGNETIDPKTAFLNALKSEMEAATDLNSLNKVFNFKEELIINLGLEIEAQELYDEIEAGLPN